ncbi:MAG: glycerol-3-phosphate dehydrogenase [Gemmatimonadetes bacterium]|nr:MAG: glycerol-3-phosphate dehydrogenase [Gemmatimonadota bacterium]PHX96521.1 MAG: glycerol-3-phosphate dehydrogenase [Gemmatimonadota bacterium]
MEHGSCVACKHVIRRYSTGPCDRSSAITSNVQPAILWRHRAREQLGGGTFDLLIVGGGITGASIARDAALRGLSVALVERDDFAGGTSSRSSRLIHGGVRYLEHGYFRLVSEASRERQTLLRTAPHLVRPLQFTWPVYRGARIGRWELRAGLALYDVLARFGNVGRHHGLSAAAVLAAEPALARDGLTGGASYWDAATDDAAITLANVLDARAAGAVVLNHATLQSVMTDGDRITGAVVRDELAGDTLRIAARVVVNATGPWTDTMRRMEDPSAGPAVLGTKGVHIAVPADRIGNRAAVTMLSPVDGRVMFCLPGHAQTIIGTTDTTTTTLPDRVRANRDDVRYLLESANRFFPAARLGPRDVIAAWAGIRPLVSGGHTGDPASASREHSITLGPRGVIAISGGKLTTYRKIAEQAVDLAVRQLKRSVSPCVTATTTLRGAERTPVFGQLFEPIVEGQQWTLSDATRAVEHELACTLTDILVRRTRVAFSSRDHGIPAAPRVAAVVARHMGWDAPECARQVEAYRAEVARLFTVDD